jgi:DNA-binding transcriptional MocR family regulator
MDLPIEVINAVKPTAKPKARKPYVKKLTKRILHAIGNGLRTSTSIANSLGVDKQKIQSNLCHIKARGLVYSSKQEGKLEHKYHLTTEKPVAKVAKVAKVASVAKPEIRRETNEEVQLKQRLSALELTLIEKEKEVWTLECELFDKKAVITYLEGKLFALGVR